MKVGWIGCFTVCVRNHLEAYCVRVGEDRGLRRLEQLGLVRLRVRYENEKAVCMMQCLLGECNTHHANVVQDLWEHLLWDTQV